MAAKTRKEALEAPATFQARGVAAPFADRRLRQVRVRAESGALPNEWEALIGDGPKPTRLPWQKLTGLFKFAPRDMALYFAISARGEKGLDPLVMRDLAAETDRDHGDDEAARTRHAELAKIAESESARAMEALRSAAEKAQCPVGDLGALAAAFAKLGVPIPGVAGFPEDGELGAAAARLERFLGEIRDYERQASPEAAQRALLAAFAASQFRALLRKDYAKLAGFVADMRQCLAAGDAALDILAHTTSRVAFALDGWVPCLDIWDEAKTRDATAVQDAVDFVVKSMPSLPREEAGGAEAAACWDGIDRQRAAFDRSMVDWIDARGSPS
jgi:hypothetical protein